MHFLAVAKRENLKHPVDSMSWYQGRSRCGVAGCFMVGEEDFESFIMIVVCASLFLNRFSFLQQGTLFRQEFCSFNHSGHTRRDRLLVLFDLVESPPLGICRIVGWGDSRQGGG